jgi:hypothetical protein
MLANGERLTDLLNRELTIVVEGARLTSHADGHTVEVGEIALERDDLFAIEALGPRGEASRRIRTIRTRGAGTGPSLLAERVVDLGSTPNLRRPTVVWVSAGTRGSAWSAKCLTTARLVSQVKDARGQAAVRSRWRDDPS